MNPLGFLGGLGGLIKGGAKQAGGFLKKGIGQLGEMEGGAEGPMLKRPQLPMSGPGGTGGFAGNEGLPQIGGNRDLINRSQPQPNALPQLERPQMQPRPEPIMDGADVSANLPMEQAEVSPMAGQMLQRREVPQVRVPDFLGPKGSTMDDTPMNRSRYAYQTEHMQHGKIPPRGWDIAASMLHGANKGFQSSGNWQGALAGAGVGGVGAAVNPLYARDQRFREEQMPRLQQQRKESEQVQDRGYELLKRDADVEGVRARTAATIAGTKDAELERRYRMAQIDKANAQAEAVARGKDVTKMIPNAETGEMEEVRFFADGTSQVLGKSGQAVLKREGFENQKTIGRERNEAGMSRVVQQGKDAYKRVQAQQGGANYRAGMSQSGQDRRQGLRLGAQYGDTSGAGVGDYGPAVPPQGKPPAVGSVPAGSMRSRFVQKAIEAGHSKEAAEAEATKRGY